MRVITGSARGRRLTSPKGVDVRPTADRVKEAIFSIIQFDIEGRRVLDLFTGTGQLAIEALSRGAERAWLVDNDPRSIAVARENIELCGFSPRAEIITGDALGYLARCRESFDIAFLDPPYDSGLVERALPLLAGRMSPGGTILCETEVTRKLPEAAGDFVLTKGYQYGSVAITMYRKGGTGL